MRTQTSRLAACLLLVACGAGGAEPGTEVEAGEFIAKTCGGCHSGSQLDLLVKGRLERETARSLADFLATHHVPDPTQRRLVSDHLERLAAQGREDRAPR